MPYSKDLDYDPFEVASQELSFRYNTNKRPDREDRYKPKYNTGATVSGGASSINNHTNNPYQQEIYSHQQQESQQVKRRSHSAAPGGGRLQGRHHLDAVPLNQNINLMDSSADRPPWLQYAIQRSAGPVEDDDAYGKRRQQRRRRQQAPPLPPGRTGGRMQQFDDFQDDDRQVAAAEGRRGGGRTMRDEDYEVVTGIPALGDMYKPRGGMRKSQQDSYDVAPNYFTLTAADLPPMEAGNPASNAGSMYESLSRDPGTGLMRTRMEVLELQEKRRGADLAKQGKINDDTLNRFYHNSGRAGKSDENILWPWSKYYSWSSRRRPIARPTFGDDLE